MYNGYPANNVYIGARYVPKLVGEWDSTKETAYEPLIIVTYQGNSYTSRQYVPAGIDISNTEYWVLTGNFNGQIESFRLALEAMNDRVDAAEQATRRNAHDFNALIIGDSYSNDSGEWPDILKTYIGADNVDVSAAPGALFGIDTANDRSFYKMLADKLSSLSDAQKNKITDVLFVGGANDWAANESLIINAIDASANLLKNTVPMARWHIVAAGWNVDPNQRINLINNAYYNYKKAAAKNGFKYSEAFQNLQNSNYFDEDGVHPNAAGSAALAGAVYSILTGGDGVLNEGVNFSVSGVLSGIVTLSKQNGYFYISPTQKTINTVTISGTFTDIGEINSPALFGGLDPGIQFSLPCAILTNSTWETVVLTCKIIRKQNSVKIQMRNVNTFDGSDFKTFNNVTSIVPAGNIVAIPLHSL